MPAWLEGVFLIEWDLVVMLSGEIGTGQVLRIHAGKGPFRVVRAEDKVGSDYYMYTGQSRYIWNNDYGDTSLLWQPSTELRIDEASYDPYPPEGIILQRVGSKLVAAATNPVCPSARFAFIPHGWRRSIWPAPVPPVPTG